MKAFVSKIALFVLILAIFLLIGLALPATPRAKTSLLFTAPAKDSLLANVKSPRLILIGGSNMSMSIDSQKIKDSLGLNPINTGIHAAIGLIYMLDHTIGFVKKGDIVVVVPEYDQFFGDFAYGSQELMRTALDVGEMPYLQLRAKQLLNTYEYLPVYALSKFAPREYTHKDDDAVYMLGAFNQYGDCSLRPKPNMVNTKIYGAIERPYNPEIINELKAFKDQVASKGARLLIAFPAFEAQSFDNSAASIKFVEKQLRSNGFEVIGKPERYRFSNSLIYDMPYHLKTAGVAIRTRMFIDDLIQEAHLKRHE